MNDKISVIIPIYNTEKYLSRCIESIIKQTYDNIEIILVNDGSTDQSSKICKKYSRIDNRVVLIEQDNKGAAAARNTGLRHATGNYIGWVDSDDYIEPDMFEKMLDCIHKENADACICQLYYHIKNKININTNGADIRNKSWLTRNEYMEKLLPDKIKSYLPVHLIRRELYKDIQFMDGNIVEDAEILPYIMEHSEKIAILPSPKYHYMVRPGSETTLWQQKQKGRIARANIFMGRTNYSKTCGYDCFSECLKVAIEYANISYIGSLSPFKELDKEMILIQSFIIQYQSEIKENPFISRYKKYIANCIVNNRRSVLFIFKYLHYIKGIVKK